MSGINHDPVDRFTGAHAARGVVYGVAGVPWWAAAVAAVGWELAENPLKDRYPEWFPHASHDTAANATFDALAVMGGWALGQFWRRR